VGYLWGHLDATYLANFVPDDLAALEAQGRLGFRFPQILWAVSGVVIVFRETQ
jgi:hypothetical protein